MVFHLRLCVYAGGAGSTGNPTGSRVISGSSSNASSFVQNGTCLYSGGSGYEKQSVLTMSGGGGAGIGGPGGSAISDTQDEAGDGGLPLAFKIRGYWEAFGGGGGGAEALSASTAAPAGQGGGILVPNGTYVKLGGDGQRGSTGTPATSGANNTGSGGGGGYSPGSAGSGGSGIVIMRFRYIQTTPTLVRASAMQGFSIITSMTYDPYANYASCGAGFFQDIDETQQCPACLDQLNCSTADLAARNVCRRCPVCSPGQIIASWNQCNGSSVDPFAPTCAACTRATNCSVGYYMSQICSGNKTVDTQVCMPCNPCPYGFYHANHTVNGITEQACTGKGLFPSSGIDCARCSNCSRGFYISGVGRCDGTGIWKDPFSCTQCKPCLSGFRHAVPCDGFTYNYTCVPCPNCPAGFYKMSTWNDATKVMDCSCVACRNGQMCQNIYEYRTGIPCLGNTTYDVTCANCSTSACRYGTSPNYTNCVESTGAFQCIPCPSADKDPPHGMRYNCSTCPPNNCSSRPGTYRMSSCGADSTFQCGLCVGCSVRHYFDSWGFCDGTEVGSGTNVQSQLCKDCLGNCKVGQYISRPCTGRENSDIEIDSCRNCTSCPYGFYHTNHTMLGTPKIIAIYAQNWITEQVQSLPQMAVDPHKLPLACRPATGLNGS